MATIRPAQVADGSALRQLWADAELEVMSADAFADLLSDDSSVVFVAEEDGDVRGAAIASFDGWRAHIYHVAVTDPFRHRGVAKELMSHAEAELRARGASSVRVAVAHDNAGGLALAYAMRYSPQGESLLRKQLPE